MTRHKATLQFKQKFNEKKFDEAINLLCKIGIEDLERRLSVNFKPFHFLFVIDLSGSMNVVDYQEKGNLKTRFELVLEALKMFFEIRLS